MRQLVARLLVTVMAVTGLVMPASASEPEQVIYSQAGISGRHDYNGRTYFPAGYDSKTPAVKVSDADTGEKWGDREITDERIEIMDDVATLSLKVDGTPYEVREKVVGYNSLSGSLPLENGHLTVYRDSSILMEPYYAFIIRRGEMKLEVDGVNYPVQIDQFITNDMTSYVLINHLQAVSNNGYYNLSIDGRIELILQEGENKLTQEKISAQDLTITGTNIATGAVRVMNASTIEEITLVVEDHTIQSVYLLGRAQVGTGGKLDRYSVRARVQYWN